MNKDEIKNLIVEINDQLNFFEFRSMMLPECEKEVYNKCIDRLRETRNELKSLHQKMILK